jgi:hypothetical protein
VKKLMIGCLITGLLLLAVAGGAAYWFIWRPGQLAQAQVEANQQIPFSPNAEGLLTPAQVTNYVAVQEQIFTKLGDDLKRIKQKYEEKLKTPSGEQAQIGMTDIYGAYQEFNTLRDEAKQARIESLNAQKMSMNEYLWVRKQINIAMSVAAVDALKDANAAVNPDAGTSSGSETAGAQNQTEDLLKKAMEAAKAAVKDANLNTADQAIPTMTDAEIAAALKNAELLKPHQAVLLKTAVVSVLDMENPMEMFKQ